jgi:zona occludens toxin
MATAIHHGPPGSFKSFALVQRFVLEALKAGRVVVTNIRGLTDIQLFLDAFPDLEFPDSAQLINIDTTTHPGRDLLAGWFHWVPFRALICIDEAQRVYPDRRDFKLESLDTPIVPPGWPVETLPEGRPEDVFTAYDMQRHYQWDIFLSTPNIAKIKKEIRESSEWAYRHRCLSNVLPWLKNEWYEHQHDPETNGKAATHRVGAPIRYKADPRIFACYQSTATGEHTESKAGTSLLKNPALQLKIGGLLFAILTAVCISVYSASRTKDPLPTTATTQAPVKEPLPAPAPAKIPAPVDVLPDHAGILNALNHVVGPEINHVADFNLINIAQHSKNTLSFLVDDGKKYLKTVSLDHLKRLGIQVINSRFCLVLLRFTDGTKKPLGCDSYTLECNVNVKTDDYFKINNCLNPSYIAQNETQTARGER